MKDYIEIDKKERSAASLSHILSEIDYLSDHDLRELEIFVEGVKQDRICLASKNFTGRAR